MNVILRKRKLGRGSTLGIRAAMQQPVTNVRNFRPKDVTGITDVGYLFRWGCTSSLSDLGLPAATTTVNTAESIQWCSNKRVGRLEMQEEGVPVPQSWATEEFPGGDDFAPDEQFVSRPSTHAQGRQLSHGNYMQVTKYPGGYISRKIDKVAEYRVFVAQNRAVWVAQKTPGNPDQVAWNVAQGGRFDNVRWDDWPKRVIQASLAAAKVSGTDFCGVDVMVDAEGNPYVLEVNSAPSQTSPYRQQCVAKVFDHIVLHGKGHFDDVPDSPRRTYKSYIHPALRGKEGSDG